MIAPRPAMPRRVVAAAVAGNYLEFYDFVAYAFFAVYIGQAFFPSSQPGTSLLLSVGVFGSGFLFRPLGSLVIGRIADRAGRRPAMLLTIILITAGTLGLALTPSYASIGVAAPVLVVIWRALQGFALGGEVGPASAFLVEIAPLRRRGVIFSLQTASQGLATLTAGTLGMLLSLLLSSDDLAQWGWRVPFLVSILLLPIALYLRRAMPETLAAPPVDAASERLADRQGLLLLATVGTMGGAVCSYVGTYMTTYAISELRLPPSTAFVATMVQGGTNLVFALAGGWLADRVGRRTIMLWPRIMLISAVWPCFAWLIAAPGVLTLTVATATIASLNALSTVTLLLYVTEALPPRLRSTGLSIVYALGVSIVGGLTQFVVTFLLQATGDRAVPAYLVMAACTVAALAMHRLTREPRGAARERRALDGGA